MAGASIEAPYTIASVPTPLDTVHGRIQAAPVYAIKGSRKRKRSEVAVGIDGEGVNIYSTRNHNLIASYALPPRSYLCNPPTSIYTRPTASTAAQRRTFLTIKDDASGSKRRLLSFTEDVKSKKSAGREFTSPEKRGCKLPDGEILSLEVIPSESTSTLSVVVNYANGGVCFISDDLTKTHWEGLQAHNTNESYAVEYVAVLDVENAKRGILRGREDVVELMEQSRTQAPSSGLLCRLARCGRERQLELYALRDPTLSSIQTRKNALQLLMSCTIPLQQHEPTATAQYELHPDSGALYQLLSGKLNIYDLSGTVPRLVMELSGGMNSFTSFSRVSSSSVLAFSHGKATLFESSFGSIQASRAISAVQGSASKGKKRKRDDAEEPESTDPVCVFSDEGLVTSLCGSEVIAFQINDPLRESRARTSRGALLSDVLGKGSSFSGQPELEKDELDTWTQWTAKTDAFIAENDIDGLERLVASDPELGRQRRQGKRDRETEINGTTNGHTTPYDDLWPLPEVFDPKEINRRKVLYLLSLVFDNSADVYSGLGIRIPSLKIVEWLALTGFLSASYLQKAFQTKPNQDQASSASVKPGDIMIAIRQIDDDFQTIRDLLSLPVQWEAGEVIQALRFVIESFNASPTEAQPLALPAPPAQPDAEIELVNGDAKSDVEIETESKAAENELDLAINALTSGLEVRSDLLRVITLRLHAFPSHIITTTMRSMMSHSEIIFFIHILRIELADGGWTSKYIDAGGDDAQDLLVNAIGGEEGSGGPSDQAINAIGDLLNCAVDAIGTSGWLVGQSSVALGTDELITSLRAEVSAGLEGCYEASTLEALLLELERCAASAGKAHREVGRIIGGDIYAANGDQSLLPLGSRMEPPSVPGRKGKDRKKSKMAVGREKSRLVGKYSFERIRV